MLKRICFLLAFCCLIIVSQKALAKGIPTISIAGFDNRVAVTNIDGSIVNNFTIVNDYLAEELLNSGKFDVYDISTEAFQGRIDELELAVTKKQGSNILDNFETDYIIYGYLTNLSVKLSVTGIAPSEQIGYDGQSRTACANLSANVVDTVTGKVVYIATGKGESTSVKVSGQYGEHLLRVGKDDVTEECVYNALAKAVHELAEKIIKAA